MAINLKEIFEGDSAFIRVEKINYNFDQILANGGGPAGPTGTTGQSGTPGQQGQPGSQGNQGYQGAPGSAGVAGDYWDRDQEYNDGSVLDPTEFHILRPYNYEEAIPNSSSVEWVSRVVLGDDNAIDSGSETPQIKPDALLTLVNESSNTQHPGIQLEFLSKGAGSSKYYFNTTPSKLSLSTIISGQAGVADISFIANNNFEIKGSDINITSTGTDINIDSNNDTIVNSNNDTIANSTNESRFNGTELSLVYSPAKAHIWSENITMVGEQINIQQNSPIPPHTAETKIFGDAIKIGNTSGYADKSAYQLVAQSVVENVVNDSSETIGGDKKIDTTGNNEILAGVNNEIDADVKNKITSADNEITATSGSNIIETNNQGDNILKINAALNSPGKNILDAGTSSTNILRNDGVDNFKTGNGLNTSDETIYFSDSDGSHIDYPTAPSDGDGVRWKKGNLQLGDPITQFEAIGSHAAPNNPSNDKNRTMADYFLKEVLTSPLFKLKKVSGAGNAWTEPNIVGDPDFSSQPSTTNSYLSYVKTGHLINGWYRGKFSTNTDWAVAPQNMNGNVNHFNLTTGGDHLALFLDNNYRFPYKHADGFSNAGAAIFEVIINCGFELQFVDFITDGTGNNEDLYGFKGVINQGSNIVWFYKYMRREAGGTDDKPWLIPLSNNDLAPRNSNGIPTSQSVDINFNFQMWTNAKAYDSVSYGNQYRSTNAPAPCHVEGTLISMADGTKKAVENIKVGDVLSSLDIGMSQEGLGYEDYLVETKDFSSSPDSSTVKSINGSNFNRYNSINNDMLKITHEHPILVKVIGDVIKWKRAEFVVVGDYILDINGNWVEVTSNVEVGGIVKVWTLDVEDNDTYFADNILVHNAEGEIKNVEDVEDVVRNSD